MENVREEGLKVLEKDRSAEFSSFYDRFKKCGFSTDGTEAWLLLQYLQISYDLVRYVDPITNKVIHIEKDGKMWESETACSDIWNCLEKCSNCISRLLIKSYQLLQSLTTHNNTLTHTRARHRCDTAHQPTPKPLTDITHSNYTYQLS